MNKGEIVRATLQKLGYASLGELYAETEDLLNRNEVKPPVTHFRFQLKNDNPSN